MKTIESDAGVPSNFNSVCAASYRKMLEQIEQVKARVVSEFRVSLTEDQRLLELAVNEAEALAWQSGFPQLFFPALAVEKAHEVLDWHSRQQSLRRGPLLALAA